MTILGIDPGTAITGFAFIEKQKEKLTLLQCGFYHADQVG